MGLEIRSDIASQLDEKLRPPHNPNIREYTLFDFRHIGSSEKAPFVNIVPGKLAFLPNDKSVLVDGKKKKLRGKQHKIFMVLYENLGQVVTPDILQKTVWPDISISKNTLRKHINYLRKSLSDNPKKPTIIFTEPKGGYRLGELDESKSAEVILPNGITFFRNSNVLKVGNGVSYLEPKERDVLLVLHRRRGGVVTRSRFRRELWDDNLVDGPAVDRYISALRKKLGSGVIETIQGLGYRLSV
jgi:DNA-binding winged helix-turn-helix (wHTH) protein